jgi:hypothetical protein
VTLTELLEINDQSLAALELTDLLDDAAVLKRLAAVEASDNTRHRYLVEDGAPAVGFRAVGDGRENKTGSDRLVSVDLKIFDASFMVDTAVADAYKGGREAFIAREAKRHMKAGFFEVESQCFYGTANDSAGFAGLAALLTVLYKDSAMVVDATGTTAGTGASVWLIRSGEDDVAAIAGDSGKLTMEETVSIRATGSSTGFFPALWTPIKGWLGLQTGTNYSVARICNLTEDSGKGLTDALIYRALSLFPSGKGPNMIAMNRRSLKQLRQSRTATNATGAPAPIPTEVEGIPIQTTDALLATETLLGATP